MINVLICGCRGAMGGVLIKEVVNFPKLNIVAGVDSTADNTFDFPVYDSFDNVKENIDVIIDFSNPACLDSLLSYSETNNTPLIICTTGFSDEQIANIHDASKRVPIFFSANMSLGINLLRNLLRKAAGILYDNFDIEIIEKHHNRKVDSPSGTAYLLGDSIREVIEDETHYAHGREGHKKREKAEIGMHAVRGGTIVGEHEVIFAGSDEIISFKHEALSKSIFATGAFKAAIFMQEKSAGLYDMDAMLNL